MTHTRPFDPALFREAAIDAETAKLNAQMIELLTDQPDCGRRGFPGRAPARRRPVPGPGDVEPGANSGDPRQGRQRNSPAGNRTGAAARDLSASPRRRLGTGRRRHAGSMLERIADNTGQAVVGVEYRLAPEHPYPAGPDDCEAAAAWLVQNGKKEFGTDALTIGGESAGGHLTAVTILRMRDRHGYTGFRGANIVYGAFDLGMTPSQRQFGNTRLVLRTIDMQQFYNAFLPTITDRREPDISPLYADLKGLCPALFSIGTKDALLDDTLFMHARWVAAGNEAELAIYPGGAHGFTLFPNDLSKAATAKMDAFLNRVLG